MYSIRVEFSTDDDQRAATELRKRVPENVGVHDPIEIGDRKDRRVEAWMNVPDDAAVPEDLLWFHRGLTERIMDIDGIGTVGLHAMEAQSCDSVRESLATWRPAEGLRGELAGTRW